MSIKTWQDKLKPGESSIGGPWCGSSEKAGHVVKIVTGKWSEQEVIESLGGKYHG